MAALISPDLLDRLNPAGEIWCVDTEFSCPPGEPPDPICLVAKELRTGRTVRVWDDDLRNMTEPPYGTGIDTLIVGYYTVAEVACHIALGWPRPQNVLDLNVEFRTHTNGDPPSHGTGLLGALAYHGLPGIDSVEKQEMRQLALRGRPFSDGERNALLAYCESDVDALVALLPVMAPTLDLPRACLRGRYMAAVAQVEANGIPVDAEGLGLLRDNWEAVKEQLVERVEGASRVYDGTKFRGHRWLALMRELGILWPLTDTGAPIMRRDVLKDMARSRPELWPFCELRAALGTFRPATIPVGIDGRARTPLWAFSASTGRTQPRTSEYLFGQSKFMRSFIKPAPGMAVAYLDWCQQELGIAAALSGDAAMIAAYQSGDPYLAAAKQAKAAPESGTKEHPARERFKVATLGVLYGMRARTLAARLGLTVDEAQQLLDTHRRTFPDFWEWSDRAVTHAILFGEIHSVFGWRRRIGGDVGEPSIRNFPAQANGAEMLRLAICYLVEAGVTVCAPVHDALLIEAPSDRIGDAVKLAQDAMAQASEKVLDGFRLRTDAEIVLYPARYVDPRGAAMWNAAWGALVALGVPVPEDIRASLP